MQLLANAGVPMIGLYWPPAWLAFVPVVAIEAWWARRTLGDGWGKAIVAVFFANAVSTLVGIPLIWLVWAVVDALFFSTALGLDNPAKGVYAVTVQAAWLIPYERDLWWMLPAAAVALTAVFGLASVAIEWAVMRPLHRGAEPGALRRWAWKGNASSYALIFAFVVAFLYVPRDFLDRIAQVPVDAVTDWAWRCVLWLHHPPAG